MLLLDTCVLLWIDTAQENLTPQAALAIRNNPQELYTSAFSAFEIAIKHKKNKLSLPKPAAEWFVELLKKHGIQEIAVNAAILLHSISLPSVHNDPADRIIIATAQIHGLRIVTPDDVIAAYPNTITVWK